MTKSLSTSSMVSSASGKKCKKPCQSSSSSSSCCTEQCIDCCSSQYQRLAEVRNMVAANQVSDSWDVNVGAVNRCGINILPPSVGATGATGAYDGETGCTGNNGIAPNPVSLNDGSTQVANLAYYFVNQFAYGPYEPGCHNDQVWGWYVDIESGELQLFTPTEGVPTNATRACLVASGAVGSSQTKQLKVLNKLYRLSKSAIKEVNGIPSQEGNIVEVCDCKGDRWLLYVNTAAAQGGASPLATCNYEFAIVATKLC